MSTKKLDRKQTDYHILIGIKDGEYYGLDYIFEHGKLKGAVGTHLRPLTPEQAQDYRDNYDFDDLWKMAVTNDSTTMGLEEWEEQVKATDGDSLFFDASGSQYEEAIRRHFEANTGQEMELTDCRGGGRCFAIDMDWDQLFRLDLWSLIVDAETTDQS